MKKNVSILLMIIVFIFTFSFGITAQELPDEITIGWCPPDVTGVFATASDYFDRAAKDAREAGINVEVVTQSPASHTDFGSQVAILEDFISRGVDAIVVSPIEVDVVKPALKKANEQGIPVIVVNLLEPIEGVEAKSYIGFSNVEAAEIAGYAMVDYLGGPGVLASNTMDNPPEELDLEFWEELYSDVDPSEIGIEDKKIAILEGVAGGFFSRQRLNGFHSVIDKYEGIEVVASRPADWNRQKGVSETEDILTAHGDELDAIFAASSEMAIGAQYAIESAGKDDQIEVITQDGTPETLKMIRNERLKAEVWHGFPEWGWYGTRFAVKAALDLEVPKQFDINPRLEYKGNADLFYPNVKLEAHPWEEIIQDYKNN